jgi:hypothetical protein
MSILVITYPGLDAAERIAPAVSTGFSHLVHIFVKFMASGPGPVRYQRYDHVCKNVLHRFSSPQ